MPQFTIRNATPDDAAALADLSRTLGYPSTVQDIRTRLASITGSRDDSVLVACMPDGSVAAWIHVFLARRIESDLFAELGGLVVAEDRRGMGIARALLKAAEAWATARGSTRIRVRSRSSRTGAHTFYRQYGFTRIKEQEVFEKTL